MLAASSTIYAAVREPERLASATDGAEEFTITLPVPDVIVGEAGSLPTHSTSYDDLRDEYVELFSAPSRGRSGPAILSSIHEAKQAP